MGRTIIYVGNFPYPSKSGVGNRVFQNVCILKDLGYKVCVIATDEQASDSQPLKDTKKEINGCDVYFLPTAKNIKQRIFYKKDLKRTLELIRELNVGQEVLALFYTGTKFALYANGLVNFCKKQKIKVVADSMDWLAIHTQNVLFNSIKRLDIAIEMKVVNKKADAMIAISTYLKEYYHKYIRNILIIPPLFALKEISEDKKGAGELIRLMYAGTPFAPNVICKKPEALKDRLDKAVEYLYKLKKQGVENFVFDIYGLTRDEYITAFPSHISYLETLQKNLAFHGKVGYEIVEKAFGDADFTFLIRDQNRETCAGFPSKVGESIASGIPVIISDVGDHSLYVHSNQNGFLIHSEDEQKALKELMEILSLDRETIEGIKQNCRRDRQFIHDTYIEQMRNFLEDIKG